MILTGREEGAQVVLVLLVVDDALSRRLCGCRLSFRAGLLGRGGAARTLHGSDLLQAALW